VEEIINEFELYKKILKDEFKDLELPPEWRPRDVIKFIISRIERID
jgi:hypothetical protein